jgi:hypothetical protein
MKLLNLPLEITACERDKMVGPWGLEPQTSTVSIRDSLIFQQLTGAHRGC